METIERSRAALGELLDRAEQTDLDFEHGILPLEDLSDRLSRVWAPVQHLNAVANNPELREAYNNCLPLLTRYHTEVGQNERLYRLYKSIDDRLPDARDDAATSVLRHALRDFRLSGVDLPAEKKERFAAIREQLSKLEAKYEQNVLDSMTAQSYHETSADALAGIPATVLEQAASNAREAGLEGWLLELDQPTYVAVVTHAENRDLRLWFYRAWVTRASAQTDAASEPDLDKFDNTGVMEEILTLRQEIARLVGYDNYAEYSLASKMAGSVEEVRDFLQDLADRTRTAAEKELRALESFAGMQLSAWDIGFYSEKLRQQQYSVSDEQLRPYFPLDTVLGGLFEVVRKLYGLRAEPVDNVDTWGPDIRYYSLVDENGDVVGGVFLDLFARRNKRSGAWMDECVSRKRIEQHLQKPVAHLVCNFAGPTKSVPCLLNHDDVLTLFHEAGHTLHHLLTRIDYPSVSGINGVPWDAVELPSQFMENFAWQPEVVKMISGHYETGDPLPSELLEKLRASRIFQAGLRMVRQLEFSLFDLRLHAEFGAESAGVMELLEEIRSELSVVPQPAFNRFPNSFTHVFSGGYAAGYYSYKWAEVLAADAWSAFESQGIFSAELANRFREKILEIGGTQEISDAFRAFRGRAPEIQPLLRQAGILPPGT
jgi:oligopeptidase A